MKLFTFDISKCNDNTIKCYKKRFVRFSKLKYDGLYIEDIYTGIINFCVDKQLIRKLKILNLDNKIKYYSSEYLILDFIENSTPINSKSDFLKNNTTYWYNYNELEFDTSINDYDKEVKRDIKVINNKIQSKMYSQKIKQYNNNRSYRK